MQTIITRSATTGKYHLSFSGAATTSCNYSGQIRRQRLIQATPGQIALAPEQAFCKKCFCKGKPLQFNQFTNFIGD